MPRWHFVQFRTTCAYASVEGGWKPIEWTVAPEPGGDSFIAIGRDLSAAKAREAEVRIAEQARRDADALYRAYFENTLEALFVISVGEHGDYHVEEINSAHEKGVGMKLDDIRGKRIDEILPAETARKVVDAYDKVVTTGEIVQYREIFELNGEPQHWDTSLVPMRDAAGQITRIMGSSRNVTRQIVAEVTLRQTQKMEAIGSLTGGVAHDCNNLLTPIIGSLDMLSRKDEASEREKRLINGALQSAERARTLVQRLLALARRQPLQPVPIDLSHLIDGMVELVRSTLGPSIKVATDIAADLPSAKAEANQVEMALLNLAVNARDAMPDGGELPITASTTIVPESDRSRLAAGEYVCLAVSDTGIGMDEQTRQRAIEPFFSTKGVGKGTGLGLSMIHGLAAQLGGELLIESVPGQGTCIKLLLPASTELPDDRQVLKGKPLPVAPVRGRALLVDDEELVRVSTADMLSDMGWIVVEADSAEAALALMTSPDKPDLLITDHLMPGMSGAQLAHQVLISNPGLPILLVSGYAESDEIPNDFSRLNKPFRKDELAASISTLIDSSHR